jgi:hypothetical protein
MNKHFHVEFSERRNNEGHVTVVIGVNVSAENDASPEGQIIIECPLDSVPDLPVGLQMALQAIEEFSEIASAGLHKHRGERPELPESD